MQQYKQDDSNRSQRCLVTGATSGIGKATALELAKHGMSVVIVGRDSNKCQVTLEEIKRESGSQDAEYLVANLSSQREIRSLAQNYLRRYQKLDVLVNNAGAIFYQREESIDGIEMTLALNHLGYFLLTLLLLEIIKDSSPARIINVSSQMHSRSMLDFNDLQNKTSYNAWDAYSQSKLANLYFTYELARRLDRSRVTVNALHPGVVATNFGRSSSGISPEEGAQTPVYLATSLEVASISGKYFQDKRETRSSDISYNREAAKRLWEISERLVGLRK